MNSTLIAFVSIGLYGLATFYEALSHLRKNRSQSSTPLITGAIALLAHIWLIAVTIGAPSADIYTLVNSTAIIGCLVVALLIGISFVKPTQNMLLVIYPAAIASIIMLLTQQPPTNTTQTLTPPIFAHVGLSILAYSILSIASIQSILIVLQNRNLKHHRSRRIVNQLPPILIMENILFDLLKAGTALLAAAILIGLIFVENIFTQHLAHKTFFSIVALSTFSTLLYGRSKYGWRGALASKLTLWGTLFLMLGFIGSKFVLENLV